MKQIVSLYFPWLPSDRLKRQMGKEAPSATTPIALAGREGQKRVITALDKEAMRQGIRPGMAVTQASALLKNLQIYDADERADAQALEAIRLWILQRYSPLVATDHDGLWIDVTGCGHLFGGDESMLADIVQQLAEHGYNAKVALAPTYGAAHVFARAMRESIRITTQQNYLPLLNTLPVSTLRLAPHIVAYLGKLGIDTIAEFREKPRKSLTLRFGKEALLRLDQVLGHVPEPVHYLSSPELIAVHRIFAEPIAAPETITRYITLLMDSICSFLEAKNLGARCLDLYCHRVDNEIKVLRVRLAQPRRDAKRLTRLMCDQLETLDPVYGIELMRLAVPWVEILTLKQMQTLGEKGDADLASLVDTLSNRIGQNHIFQVIPQESDVPERSYARVAPFSSKPCNLPSSYPRPIKLFVHPEPIQTIAMLPDYPPVSFTWRGRRHKVRLADGPERIYGEWWKRDAEMEAVRDYFQLENEDGARFWVFRSGDGVLDASVSGKWFMHGIFG